MLSSPLIAAMAASLDKEAGISSMPRPSLKTRLHGGKPVYEQLIRSKAYRRMASNLGHAVREATPKALAKVAMDKIALQPLAFRKGHGLPGTLVFRSLGDKPKFLRPRAPSSFWFYPLQGSSYYMGVHRSYQKKIESAKGDKQRLILASLMKAEMLASVAKRPSPGLFLLVMKAGKKYVRIEPQMTMGMGQVKSADDPNAVALPKVKGLPSIRNNGPKLTKGTKGQVPVNPFSGNWIRPTQKMADGWEDTAKFHARNEEFWRNIVMRTGDILGPKTREQDDGGIADRTLGLRVPEVAAELVAKNASTAAGGDADALKKLLKMHGPSIAHAALGAGAILGGAHLIKRTGQAIARPYDERLGNPRAQSAAIHGARGLQSVLGARFG